MSAAKQARQKTEDRTRFTIRERNRLRILKHQQQLKESEEKQQEPPPPLLMITAADVPSTPRGELVWTDGDRIAKPLFYEIEKTKDNCLALHLYGLPVSMMQIYVRYWTPKKALLCPKCNQWCDGLLFPWVDLAGHFGPWCRTCFHHGTPRDHKYIKLGLDDRRWPIRWPVEAWGNREPLRIRRKGGTHGR